MRCPFQLARRTDHNPERFRFVRGAPGVGKTTKMLADIDEMVQRTFEPGKDIFVTSKTHFAVDNANQRMPELKAETIHGMLWDTIIRQLHDQGEIHLIDRPTRRGRPAYFGGALLKGDAEMLSRYVRDAPSRTRREDQEMARFFTALDPTKHPIPEGIEARVTPSCAFHWTLLQFCLWADRSFDQRGHPPAWMFPPTIFVDEAQDAHPIEALALGWLCLIRGYNLIGYGDPQQAMDQNCLEPKLLEVADAVTEYRGEVGRRRVPLEIARLAERVLPGLAPPAEEWADPTKPGEILNFRCADSAKHPATRGFNLGESRDAAKRCVQFSPVSRFYLSPEKVPPEERATALVCATPFGVKGYESNCVTIQRWKPKHQRAYMQGDIQARRRLYVSLTRCTHRLAIHEEMRRMIHEGASCNLEAA